MFADEPPTTAGDPGTAIAAPLGLSENGACRPRIVNRATVVLSFLAIWLIWGSTYLAIRYTVETIPPLYAVAMRHVTAGMILFIWCLWNGKRPTREQVRASVVIGFFFFLIGHGALHWAETRIPSSLASLLIATEPICVFALFEIADRRWRMNGLLFWGVVIGLAGVALLLKGSVLTSTHGMFIAAVAVLIGSFSWSIGVVYSRRSHLSGHPMLLSALSLLSGSVMLLVAGTVAGEWRGFSFGMVSRRSWGALAYLIIFGSVIAFSAYNWLMEHYPPTLVSTHTYINPIVAVLLGWFLAGEKMTLVVGVAAAMVIGAVILVERGMAKLDAGSLEARSLENRVSGREMGI